MNIARRKFNPPRYIQTVLSKNVQHLTAQEVNSLIVDCFFPFLEDLAEFIEDNRPDLQGDVDEAMAKRGFDP